MTMSDGGYDELDETVSEEEEADAAPQLVFGSVDEFVRE